MSCLGHNHDRRSRGSRREGRIQLHTACRRHNESEQPGCSHGQPQVTGQQVKGPTASTREVRPDQSGQRRAGPWRRALRQDKTCMRG